MRVRLEDVARAASVSSKTVSRVPNDEANVSDATRQRVLAAMAPASPPRASCSRGTTPAAAANDDMATGVMWAAGEYGLKVPHDLSVCGFGDVRLLVSRQRLRRPSHAASRMPSAVHTTSAGDSAIRVNCHSMPGPAVCMASTRPMPMLPATSTPATSMLT